MGEVNDRSRRIPSSVAAFHLAFGPDGWLYVTAPTLSPRDVVYRVSPEGALETFCDGLGRPQGLAFDSDGHLYVVDAVAGSSAVYRFRSDRPGVKDCVLSGGALLGLAFDPLGGLVVCVERDRLPARRGAEGCAADPARAGARVGLISVRRAGKCVEANSTLASS